MSDFINTSKRVKWIDEYKLTSEIINTMVDERIDSFMIMQGRVPIGIFTAKDALRVKRKRFELNRPIKEYMSSPVQSINKNKNLKDALEFIDKKHFKRIVLVDDNGFFVGVISQKELFAMAYSRWVLMMKEHQRELNKLNAMLESKNKIISDLAAIDALTGLYNRREFSDFFEKYSRDANETRSTLYILMCDIDYFKNINDTKGHSFGDEVLRGVARSIKNSLRDGDMVARWGGEEFVVLFVAKDDESAIGVAQKIRQNVAKLRFENFENSVTISIGASRIRADDTIQMAIDRADKAMYRAKNNGRDRVEFCTLS